jgi:fumarate hydratase class II
MHLILREMFTASATLNAGASAKHAATRLDDQRHGLVAHIGTEILTGRPEFLNAWMTGSNTQFNLNEGASDRCRQLAGTALGTKKPVLPVDYVNKSLLSNDTFPSAISA